MKKGAVIRAAGECAGRLTVRLARIAWPGLEPGLYQEAMSKGALKIGFPDIHSLFKIAFMKGAEWALGERRAARVWTPCTPEEAEGAYCLFCCKLLEGESGPAALKLLHESTAHQGRDCVEMVALKEVSVKP